MNVISLFDGMSCAMIALQKLGIKPKKYFASEIDKYAIQVSKANWPEIIHIGDVTRVHYFEGVLYTEFGSYEVDFNDGLLCGGSPCQGFSFAGKQLNFEDPRSKLFFEFVRIWKEIKAECPSVKVFLENVNMRKEWQKVISDLLQIQPILLNSSLVSAQNRERLYWTNIYFQGQPADRKIAFKDIFDTNEKEYRYLLPKTVHRNINNSRARSIYWNSQDKLPTILHNQKKQSTDSIVIILENGKRRWLSPLEAERAQGVPENYTDKVAFSNRNAMLGNGWNVDTIVHLFEPLLWLDVI